MAKIFDKDKLDQSLQEYKKISEALITKDLFPNMSSSAEIEKIVEESAQQNHLNIYTVCQNYKVRGEIIPGKVFGGDFMDLFTVGTDKIGLILGDVSDKSVPATLFMTIAKTMARSLATNLESPRELMEKANLLLSYYNSTNMFLSAFYGVFDPKTGTLKYANAGHYSPYILSSDGSIRKLEKTSGIVLGIKSFVLGPFPGYQEQEIQLRSNDCLVMYSDGLINATNQDMEMYSEVHLEHALQKCHEKPFSELIEYLINDVKSFIGTSKQEDDITIFSLKYL